MRSSALAARSGGGGGSRRPGLNRRLGRPLTVDHRSNDCAAGVPGPASAKFASMAPTTGFGFVPNGALHRRRLPDHPARQGT